jgi:hypothetical protein
MINAFHDRRVVLVPGDDVLTVYVIKTGIAF